MMKRLLFFSLSLMLALATSTQAQTLIDEGFEDVPGTSATETLPGGWERVNTYSGATVGYRWTIGYTANGGTMSGHRYAYCNAPTYIAAGRDGVGPRKEVLLTPAVELDNTYQLSFDWEAAAASVLNKGEYTLQVAVIDMAAPSDTTVIFDITNEQQVRDSGVPADPYGTYIWANWAVQTSKLDLTPWRNKTVKVAFIFNMKKSIGNILYLDNILIKQYTPLTGPIAELSQPSYTFPIAYIGEKLYSEALTLKNVGLAGLQVTGVDAPAGFGVSIDSENINLGINETAQFQIYYLASLTSPTQGDIVIHTNGGDVTLHATASKQAVPDGYELELFEGAHFPPAGWHNGANEVNEWTATHYALEGDYSLYGAGFIEDSHIYLPRLDLSDPNTPRDLMFTYYAHFVSDDVEAVPSNDLLVEASTDGGQTWDVTLWTADYTKVDTIINVTVDLTSVASDTVLLRFTNTACYYDSEYGMDPASSFIIDRVLLPGVYGADGAPLPGDVISPADGAINIYNKNIKLEWTEAQFATGYRLCVGTSSDNADVINQLDLGNVTSYVLESVNNATTYYWWVIPYNEVGAAADVPVWSFTTQEDHTVSEFPWFEGFDGDLFAPLGWLNVSSTLTKWSASNYNPFDGKKSAMAYSNETGVEAVLTTPDVQLPAGQSLQLSFWWGNDRPASLIKDDTQVHVNHSTVDDGIDAAMMDIFVDGQWQQVKLISDNKEGTDADGEPIRYWAYETLDLTPYAGKTVAFRWRYISHNYNRSRGASLDNVKIEEAGAAISFSMESWDAYKVNAGKVETSPSIAMTNLGSSAATVTAINFANNAFTTTLKAGDTLEPTGSKQFTISFAAGNLAAGKDSVVVDDEMEVTFDDGKKAYLSVSAIALPRGTYYYGFEHDATGVGPEGFTVIDVDRLPTSPLNFWDFPNNGMALSFFVLNADQCYNSMEEPHGKQSLMTRCNTNGTFEDWIVSAPMVATSQSKFDFDMRNWESTNSISPLSTPTVTVLVSTTSATDRNSFTIVGDDFTPELYDGQWSHLSYDLSEYAGQKIYVAVQAEATSCLGAFYDNFEFAHFTTSMDVNGDGNVDGNDLNCLINHVLGKQTWTTGDVNNDGTIDGNDINAMINYLLGK